MTQKIGLIAGSGVLPRLIRDHCQRQNIPLHMIGVQDNVDPDTLKDVSYDVIGLGQVKQAIKCLQEEKVTDIIFAGGITRPSFKSLKMDALAMKWLFKFGKKAFGDDGLLHAITQEFERLGFHIVGAHEFLKDILMPFGVLGHSQPTEEEKRDVLRGFQVAKALGREDIGQAVVIENGVVLAVEAIEGTARLIARAKAYKREAHAGVLVKACKPQQDKRVDLPTIGPDTIKQAQACGLRGIAVEAKRGLILEKERVITLADEYDIFLYGFEV